MKRQFVIGRITVQRFASKQMRAKHAEDSNARFDTASFFAVRLGLVSPEIIWIVLSRRDVPGATFASKSLVHCRRAFIYSFLCYPGNTPLPPVRFSGTATVKITWTGPKKFSCYVWALRLISKSLRVRWSFAVFTVTYVVLGT